jgi:uncharacterized protein (TIGR00251 family)
MHIFLEIKVVPSSGKQKCITEEAGDLKCYLKSNPEGGKANKELIKFISKKLKIPQFRIVITSGKTLRKKRIKIVTEQEENVILKLLL